MPKANRGVRLLSDTVDAIVSRSPEYLPGPTCSDVPPFSVGPGIKREERVKDCLLDPGRSAAFDGAGARFVLHPSSTTSSSMKSESLRSKLRALAFRADRCSAWTSLFLGSIAAVSRSSASVEASLAVCVGDLANEPLEPDFLQVFLCVLPGLWPDMGSSATFSCARDDALARCA